MKVFNEIIRMKRKGKKEKKIYIDQDQMKYTRDSNYTEIGNKK